MEAITMDGLTLCFNAEEREAAQLIGQACEKSARLIRECWGLAVPQDLRVYVMTSWLHEGLAMVTVDRFLGRPTVKEETIAALARSPGAASPGRRYPRFTAQDADAIVYLYVRGYWLTRYIEEKQPGLLKSLFARRYRHDELESQIASAFGMGRDEFWRKIDGIVAARLE